MTGYKIFISKTAIKQLNSLDKKLQESLKSSIKELEKSPFEPRPGADIKKLHKLTKNDFYRLRVGSYRIIYSVEHKNINIVKIFRREKGYEWLD